MIKISRDEVLKIAEMTRVSLHENEIVPMIKHLEDVLSYAERVQEIKDSTRQNDIGNPGSAEQVGQGLTNERIKSK